MLGAPSYRQSIEDAEDVFFPHHLTICIPFCKVVLYEVPSTPLWGGCCCAWSSDRKGASRKCTSTVGCSFGWGKRAGKRSRLERSKWEPAASGKKPPCKFSFETELVAFWWCYHVLPLMVVVLTSSNCVWTTTFPHLRFPDVQHCFNKEQEKHQQYFQKATSLIWSANDGKRLVPGDADGGFIDKAGKENRSILAILAQILFGKIIYLEPLRPTKSYKGFPISPCFLLFHSMCSTCTIKINQVWHTTIIIII